MKSLYEVLRRPSNYLIVGVLANSVISAQCALRSTPELVQGPRELVYEVRIKNVPAWADRTTPIYTYDLDFNGRPDLYVLDRNKNHIADSGELFLDANEDQVLDVENRDSLDHLIEPIRNQAVLAEVSRSVREAAAEIKRLVDGLESRTTSR